MNKTVKRLIVFFIGVPVMLSIILFFPHQNFLLFNLFVIIFSILGAVEFRNILTHKNMVISVPEAVMLGAISPAAWTAAVSFGFSVHVVPGAFVLGTSWLIVSRIFTSKEELASYIGSITAGFAVMIYPGIFLAWIVRMAVFPRAGLVILLFLLVVCLNDSAAWLSGVLFGKGNRGIVMASTNKSLAGFIGGLFASVLIGVLATVFFPNVFASAFMPSILAGALLGFGTGTAAILGDLGESAIKRSAGVKDSGALILGRGGALDSIDSLALAAPVFCLIYQVLF